jgi:hypothetical protein
MMKNSPWQHKELDVTKAKQRTNKPSAEVIPFPAMRRKPFINGAWIKTATMPDDEADDYFRTFITRYRNDLEALGVASRHITAEARSLEGMFGCRRDSAAPVSTAAISAAARH